MKVRMDLKNFFSFIKSRQWSDSERQQRLAEVGILRRWAEVIKKEIDFLEKWIRRFM